MRDYREDIDSLKIAEYLKNREPQKPLEEEKINQIKSIILACKNISNIEKEKKRYEIRNLCK